MKITIRKAIGWILIVMGFIFYLFFKKYHGDIFPYPTILFLIGIAMVISGILLLRKTSNKELSDVAEILKTTLKEQGTKIAIDLNDCEIKEDYYNEEKDPEKEYSEFELLNFYEEKMFAKSNDNKQQNANTKKSIVVAEIQHRGKSMKIRSAVLPYERVKLLMEFMSQQKTYVYIDKTDASLYYFDFEFLRKK